MSSTAEDVEVAAAAVARYAERARSQRSEYEKWQMIADQAAKKLADLEIKLHTARRKLAEVVAGYDSEIRS